MFASFSFFLLFLFHHSADVISPPSARSRWFSSIQSWLVDKAYNIMADLSQEPEEDTEPKAEEEELSVKVLVL